MGKSLVSCFFLTHCVYAQTAQRLTAASYYLVVFLHFTNCAQVHLTLYTDVFPVIQMLLNLFLIKYGRSNSCIGKKM